MIPEDKKWSDESISVSDCKMQNSEYIDLSQVWHNAKEEPQGDNWKILCVDDFDLSWVEKRANMIGLHNNWDEYTVIEGVKMWAYISDLLPKQFGNSKRLKGEHNGNND